MYTICKVFFFTALYKYFVTLLLWRSETRIILYNIIIMIMKQWRYDANRPRENLTRRVTREIDYEQSGNAFAGNPGARRAERARRKLAEDVPYFQPCPTTTTVTAATAITYNLAYLVYLQYCNRHRRHNCI